MNEIEITEFCIDFMGKRMREWDVFCEGLDQETRIRMGRALAEIAAHATRAGAYIEGREQGGSHEAGVRRANRRVAKVREALGFTQARDDINF